ncbi:MAG: CPBP family intramembrane metalloprotease [candidate division Zixibacteria bacterium]|nr:CPBP family intramembrane metalloprotease [candidate division Zixibacteria bacterium]
MVEAQKLRSEAVPVTTLGRIAQFPLVRMILALLFIGVPVAIHNLSMIFGFEKIPEPWLSRILVIETILLFFLILYAYRLYTRHIEKRRAHEISPAGSARETAYGLALGAGLVTIQVALMAALSYYRVESIGSVTVLLYAFFTFGIGAFLQEMFFRGIVFRNLEELMGSWAALVVVALIFGAVHLGNENATIWTSLALIAADVFLTAAYMLTRRIWFVWGIHWGWNYLQDGVFGMPNSGITSLKSWINCSIEGPDWLTGGSFGIEASWFAIGLSILIAAVLLKMAIVRKQILKPGWYKTTPDTGGAVDLNSGRTQ